MKDDCNDTLQSCIIHPFFEQKLVECYHELGAENIAVNDDNDEDDDNVNHNND